MLNKSTQSVEKVQGQSETVLQTGTVPLKGNVALACKTLSSEQNRSIKFRVPLYFQGT